MTTSVTVEKKPTRFRTPSFGVQVLIGLVLGVVLGLVARAMGADGVDATTGEVDGTTLRQEVSDARGSGRSGSHVQPNGTLILSIPWFVSHVRNGLTRVRA